MEETKILLGKNKHKLSTNEDNFVGVELSSYNKVLPYLEDTHYIDAYQQYYKEKGESDKYRFVFTITPFCTNVLFNVITEPVYKEGSDECFLLLYGGSEEETVIMPEAPSSRNKMWPFHWYKSSVYFSAMAFNTLIAIRDTAFSNPEASSQNTPIVYHCGIDIFNNHLLRRTGYSVVRDANNNGSVGAVSRRGVWFNTIGDVLRNKDGFNIKETVIIPIVPTGATTNSNSSNGRGRVFPENTKLAKVEITKHLYQHDNILSYMDAVDKGLVENNGWYGFLNAVALSGADVHLNYSGRKISINKCMSNNKAWEQYDMYPDRSLFSFVPKINKYRDRIEQNWNYCLTYPSRSITDNEIVEGDGINGLYCKIITELEHFFELETEDGITKKILHEDATVTFKSVVNHNLKAGDYVTFSFKWQNGEIHKTDSPVKIMKTGNEENEDKKHYFSVKLSSILNEVLNETPDGALNFANIGSIRFRKCENNNEAKYYIRVFKKFNGNYTNSLNKLAFSQSVYGDQTAQIVFTEDFKTFGLKDNLGRTLSEVYLTIVKANKGYQEWYGEDNTVTVRGEEIEFSHCFGDIKSGFDMPNDEDEDFKRYNVRRIHGIPAEACDSITPSPEWLESGITIENDEFIGDIVEFFPYALKETVIEPVYHRFNTAQRETTNTNFSKFYFDEIKYDDYDMNTGATDDNPSGFTIQTTTYNEKVGLSRVNLVPEGYYYKPHYRVDIRQYEKEVQWGSHISVEYKSVRNSGGVSEIKISKNYYFEAADEDNNRPGTWVHAYKILNGEVIAADGVCVSAETVNGAFAISIRFDEPVNLNENEWALFKHNTEMPEEAYTLPDGSGRYLWRNFDTEGETFSTEDSDEIFTNGAHYFHKNIRFYLKRQDPDGSYGIGQEPSQLLSLISVDTPDDEKEISSAKYMKEGEGTIC